MKLFSWGGKSNKGCGNFSDLDDMVDAAAGKSAAEQVIKGIDSEIEVGFEELIADLDSIVKRVEERYTLAEMNEIVKDVPQWIKDIRSS